MADQKTPASAEIAKNTKAELSEAQLKDVAGGAMVDPPHGFEPIYMNKADTRVQTPTTLVTKP